MKKDTLQEYSKIEEKFSVKFPNYEGEVYIIDEYCFEYYYMWKGEYGGPWVTVQKNKEGKWYYDRLNKVSQSEEFDDLQKCIDIAYIDMMRSKY